MVEEIIIKNKKIFCRNCKKVTNHSVLQNVVRDDSDEENEIWVRYEYKTLQCKGCEIVCLLEEITCSEDYDPETGQLDIERRVYPESSYGDRDSLSEAYLLPNIIKSIYIETITSFNHNLYILTGIGLRAIVEAICKDKKIIKGKLNRKINQLQENGFMTEQEVELLHMNRYIGNSATHELIKIPKDELKTGLDIIESILQNAYILPQKVKQINLRKEFEKQ